MLITNALFNPHHLFHPSPTTLPSGNYQSVSWFLSLSFSLFAHLSYGCVFFFFFLDFYTECWTLFRHAIKLLKISLIHLRFAFTFIIRAGPKQSHRANFCSLLLKTLYNALCIITSSYFGWWKHELFPALDELQESFGSLNPKKHNLLF